MADFEKLGMFYLGRRYDAAAKAITAEDVLYDSKDLVTHALCVGMTGSGKTGLGIALIEEAAIDNVPVIVIDPKGDLTNLLLTFPALAPADFAPWVNTDDAARAGKTIDAFAADQAAKWSKGLQEWGQDGARIQKLRDAVDVALYTPGSTAGLPVSVLTSFARPPLDDPELIRERVQTTISSLLALAGVDAEPLKSREHILLSTILLSAWQAGESPDLATLIQRVQQPPITRVGVMDIESFFPAKDRFAFAMTINALLASPGFEVWSQGDPMDVAAFLRTSGGKPRVSIFSIAHLDDSQRMFFVSLLLNAVAGWMRGQSGTSSLRAMVYMDEIFGYFPPTANPPSKTPLLTLLKQGRAAGVGVVLGTQNPVDLDYKGLSNIGTWFLGRLQTDRDKARLLDGLEGAGDAGFDRGEVDALLSGLTSRVFLMRNVHDPGLTLLHSRWALSYLRGPLGREEIKRLTKDQKTSDPYVASAFRRTSDVRLKPDATKTSDRPILPPDIPQFFSPDAEGAGAAPLRPVVYGFANVRFVDAKAKVDTTENVSLAADLGDGPLALDWEQAEAVDWTPESLERDAPDDASYAAVPVALKVRSFDGWSKQLVTCLAGTQKLELFRSPSTGEVSRPGETERDFRARIQHGSRENRDREVEALRRKFAPRIAMLDEKLRRAEQAVDREAQQASGSQLQTVISVGASLAGMFLGRKTISAGNIGRATTAARGMGRMMKESQDIGRAKETVEALKAQRQELEDELKLQTATLESTGDAALETLEPIVVRPKKTNVTVKLVALVWTP